MLYSFTVDKGWEMMYTILMRINLTLDENLLKDFDDYCVRYHYDRSEFIRKLIRDEIYKGKEERVQDTRNDVQHTQVKEVEVKDTIEVNPDDWCLRDDIGQWYPKKEWKGLKHGTPEFTQEAYKYDEKHGFREVVDVPFFFSNYGEMKREWCSASHAHPFVKAEVRDCYRVSIFDGEMPVKNQVGKVLTDCMVCKDCIVKYNKEMVVLKSEGGGQ